MVAVIDYGAGNLRSVENAMKILGQKTVVTSDPDTILGADHVILPGVGAFGDAMEKLRSRGIEQVIHDVAGKGTPFLGICLGLQLLFDESEESKGVKGLSLLPGKIVRFPEEAGLKIPEIGWNDLTYHVEGRLFQGIPEHSYVYFVHSYCLAIENPQFVTATSTYGMTFGASVEKDNIFACQFHPEKSERVGMQILRNFLSV